MRCHSLDCALVLSYLCIEIQHSPYMLAKGLPCLYKVRLCTLTSVKRSPLSAGAIASVFSTTSCVTSPFASPDDAPQAPEQVSSDLLSSVLLQLGPASSACCNGGVLAEGLAASAGGWPLPKLWQDGDRVRLPSKVQVRAGWASSGSTCCCIRHHSGSKAMLTSPALQIHTCGTTCQAAYFVL